MTFYTIIHMLKLTCFKVYIYIYIYIYKMVGVLAIKVTMFTSLWRHVYKLRLQSRHILDL